MRKIRLALAILANTMLVADGAFAALVGLEQVATGLDSPLFATHAPNDPSRLFIVERGEPVGGDLTNSTARVRILNLNSGTMLPTPFLTITGLDTLGEGGLLGMAFHPNYATNGRFYLYATADDSNPDTASSSQIRQYTRSSNPNVANPSFSQIMNIPQTGTIHKAGWVGFGPRDGYLYIMSGDGGGNNEPGGTAQDIETNLLGKVLRVDVNRDDFTADPTRNYGIPFNTATSPGNPFAPDVPGASDPTGLNEIWAYGLRNPYRASFDRQTGDLWIGDVGAGAREEVDFQLASSQGGENYGWSFREGTIPNPDGGGPAPPGAVNPIWDYKRIGDPTADPNFTGNLVIGGYAYRGPDPDLQGQYFFADGASGNIWSLRRSPLDVDYVSPQLLPDQGDPQQPVSFGEDSAGNLYVVYFSGSVYRIATDTTLVGDYNSDGNVNQSDYSVWRANFGSTTNLAADGNHNNIIDLADYAVWRQNLGLTGSGGNGVIVPEPAALASIVSVIALVLLSARRRDKLDV